MIETRDDILAECLALADATCDQPFRDQNWTVVRHRANRKVFAWVFERKGRMWVNVKCDPEWRDVWRQAFASVVPAYHLNKTHWNSVILDGGVPDEDIRSMIVESYELTKPKPKPKAEAQVASERAKQG